MVNLHPLLRRLLFTLLGVGVATFIVLSLTPKPCSKPLTFSLGTIDNRFNVPQITVKENLRDVVELWNNAHAGGPLLSFVDTGGKVKISFVYDERQRTTIKNERLKRQISEQKNKLSEIKQTLEITQAEYDRKNAQIQADTGTYLKRLSDYQEQVAQWNAKGGAPSGVYEALKQEQLALEVSRLELNNQIADLNALGQQIKNQSGKHNAVVDDVNAKVDVINATAGKEFEEGVYDPNTKTITIYEFESPLSLKRVLAHELGHALGIDHVEGSDSIMYPYNDSDVFQLSPEDKQAIASICKGN